MAQVIHVYWRGIIHKQIEDNTKIIQEHPPEQLLIFGFYFPKYCVCMCVCIKGVYTYRYVFICRISAHLHTYMCKISAHVCEYIRVDTHTLFL